MLKIYIRSAWLTSFTLLNACVYNIIPVVAAVKPAVHGTVLDADTELPIEGANVVVIYHSLKNGFLHNRGQGSVLAVEETITDARGHFDFRTMLIGKISFDESPDYSPTIIVFKPDYGTQNWYEAKAYEQKIMARPSGARHIGNFDGRKQYVLQRYSRLNLFPEAKPFSGWSPELYSHVSAGLSSVIRECLWSKIPKMMLALTVEAPRAQNSYPNVNMKLPTLTDLEIRRASNPACNSAIETTRGTS